MNVKMVKPGSSSAQMVWCSMKVSSEQASVTSLSMWTAAIVRNYVRFVKYWLELPFKAALSETPRGTSDFCPRKNGIFSHPDESICNIFFTCVDGEYIEAKCTAGLLFNEESGTCVWPENAGRDNCQENKKTLKDGFVCPTDSRKNDHSGQVVAHPHYIHPTDCQKFYVCLNGLEPRELRCDDGEVFDDETKRCDSPSRVPGCEDWYSTDPIEE